MALGVMLLLASLLTHARGGPHDVDGTEVLRVGHWLEVRGAFDEDGRFVASRVELMQPEKYELLIGTVEQRPFASDRFLLFGQEVHVSRGTDWEDVDLDGIAGRRVKLEGRYRGPRNLSAKKVSRRGPGRERIGGRVDQILDAEGGIEVRIMRFRILLPAGLELEHGEPLNAIALAPQRVVSVQGLDEDEDDLFGEGIRITDDLQLIGQLSVKSTFEDDFDLDDTSAKDRADFEASARTRFVWRPSDDFTAVHTLRYSLKYRDDQDEPGDADGDFALGETYGYWRNALGDGWDLQVGRQDFDERREWIYDQNLDAVRLIGTRQDLRIELSASATLFDGGLRDESSTNLIGYVSNNHERRHLGAYAVYRDIDLPVRETPLHLGARAHGRWLADNKSWLDLAVLRGKRAGGDIHGYALDLGTTWMPDFADRFSFTIGYAFGTGDRTPAVGSDRTFRQTGFQDNNDKFDGVTSFRYYGELLDPELANLQILSAGIGARVAEKTSLDLVMHYYKQDAAQPFLINADLDRKPSGNDREIGWELDLILGSRRWKSFDFELVGGWFRPGDAFTQNDDAFLAKIQLRYRF